MKKKYLVVCVFILSAMTGLIVSCTNSNPTGPLATFKITSTPTITVTATPTPQISLNQTSWLVSSAPAFNYPNTGTALIAAATPASNRVRFYDDVVSPNIDFEVNTSAAIAGGGGHVYSMTAEASDVVNVLRFPYAHLSNQTWAGLRQVISATGTNFSSMRSFQTWIYNDGKDKWIMFDFGVINEDSNGNGVLDSDAVTNISHPNLNYGIPTFYMSGTPWAYGSGSGNYIQDVNGNYGFVGLYLNEVSQEGQSNGGYITENTDGTGVLNLTDAYFEYGIRANWTGWKQVKIPVNLTSFADLSSSTSTGVSYFYHAQGSPTASLIRTLRLWITGASATVIDGAFVTDFISFSPNS